jgi:hypothetical protein
MLTTSPGRRRFWMAWLERGTLPSFSSASTTPRGASKGLETPRGAGASQEDGSILGRVCRNRKPEHTGLEMVTYRSGNEQDDDLG